MIKNLTKKEVFIETEKKLINEGFEIVFQDQLRPWGGFFVIDENQAQKFANIFFEGINTQDLKISGKLSPKILMVAPEMKLSWQYHHRRAEIWRVVEGTVGVITSETDTEGALKILNPGDKITLDQGERHRLVGLNGWGIIAEIWQHTDKNEPSDEEDIVRVQDDFGR